MLQKGIDSLQKQGYQYTRHHGFFQFRKSDSKPGELLCQNLIRIDQNAPHSIIKETFRNGAISYPSFTPAEIQAIANICRSFSDTDTKSEKEDSNAKH